MRIVDVKNLSCSFRKVLALDDIDFSIEPGKVYGLVGANGAGKTTLLRHILGLYRPQQGTVSVYGLDPVRHPQSVLQRVGYLSEHLDLPEWMKISELLQYLRAYFPTWDMQYAHKLVETFRLDPGKKISELSQGMRAQTGLIAALAHRPELLILDEPSNGLDAVIRLDIIDAIIRTVAEEGRSVLFSSHLLDEMERTCDHVTMIQDGRIAISGELDDIRQEYRVSSIRFPEAPGQIPQLEGTHILASNGHMMKLVHRMTVDSLASSVNPLGGEVTDSRHACLEEVFLARAGRAPSAREAA